MQIDINKFYDNSEPEEGVEWKVDAKCAVLTSKKKQWYRACIIEFVKNDQVKVFLKDFATKEKVPVCNLRTLDEKFCTVLPGAIKCHLSGIKPAGKEWPGISCEFLTTEIENYPRFYITKLVRNSFDKSHFL